MIFRKETYRLACTLSLWIGLLVLIFVSSCTRKDRLCDPASQQKVFQSVDFLTLRDHLDSIVSVARLDSNCTLVEGMKAFIQGRKLTTGDAPYFGYSFLRNSLKKFGDIGYETGEGYAYFLIATGFQKQLKIDSAMVHYELAKLKFHASGDTTGLLSVYNNMGNYFARKRNLVMAEQNYAEAEKLLSFPSPMATLLTYNIASFRLEAEDSLSYPKVKASLIQLLNHPEYLDSLYYSNIYNSLSVAEILLENPDSAIVYALKSISYSPGTRVVDLHYQYLNLANCYVLTNRMDDFNEVMNKVAGIYKQLEPDSKKQYHYAMINAVLGKQRHHLVKYTQLASDIENEGFSDKLLEIKNSFAIKEKQAQIDILAKNNELQKAHISLANFISGLLIVFVAAMSVLLFFMYRQRTHLQRSRAAIEAEQQKTEVANQALASALNTKDRLLSVIAHDLRGPLGGQKELIELYADMPDLSKKDVRQFFATAKESSASVYLLLENLLMWANNQRTGRDYFAPVEQNVVKLITDTTATLKSWAELKKIQISIHGEESVLANVDANMFKTIVRNLISNAIKYSGSGKNIKVWVTQAGGEVVVSVVDQGRGIHAELLANLFQRQEDMMDRSLSDSKAGLGLVLCSDFTERHHGRIWAESEEGKGTTVSFTIPMVIEE